MVVLVNRPPLGAETVLVSVKLGVHIQMAGRMSSGHWGTAEDGGTKTGYAEPQKQSSDVVHHPWQ